MEERKSVFETLNAVNVNGHTEKKKTGKDELTYLSWPWAWAEVKSRYPQAHYTIWKDANGRPYTYDPLTGYMVYTEITIDSESHSMWLPVMDGANNAMKSEPYDYKVKNPNFKFAKWDASRGGYFDKYGNQQEEYITKHVEAATMFDVNKAIMRCLVKNLAMFGLGLYIYAGEDLPDGETAPKTFAPDVPEAKEAPAPAIEAQQASQPHAAADKDGASKSVLIAQCKVLAEKLHLEALVNESGYKGKPWENMSASSVQSLKQWLCAKDKEAGKKEGAA